MILQVNLDYLLLHHSVHVGQTGDTLELQDTVFEVLFLCHETQLQARGLQSASVRRVLEL